MNRIDKVKWDNIVLEAYMASWEESEWSIGLGFNKSTENLEHLFQLLSMLFGNGTF